MYRFFVMILMLNSIMSTSYSMEKDAKYVEGSEIYSSKKKKVGSYTSLDSCAPIRILLMKPTPLFSPETIEICGDHNIIGLVQTRLVDNTLFLKLSDKVTIKDKYILTVCCYRPTYEAIIASEFTTLSMNESTWSGSDCFLNMAILIAQNSAQVNLYNIKPVNEILKIRATENACITCRGIANKVKIFSSEKSFCDCSELIVSKKIEIFSENESKVTVNADKVKLNAFAFASNNIGYKGTPRQMLTRNNENNGIYKI